VINTHSARSGNTTRASSRPNLSDRFRCRRLNYSAGGATASTKGARKTLERSACLFRERLGGRSYRREVDFSVNPPSGINSIR